MKNVLVLFFSTLILLNVSISYAELPKSMYVAPNTENLRDSPKGAKLGILNQGTTLKIIEEQDKWVKVNIEGWIWKPSLTSSRADLEKTASPDLELTAFDITGKPINTRIDRYSAVVDLNLRLKNNTSKRIKAWKSVLIVKNSFEETILKIKLTSGNSSIKPGESTNAVFQWEDNQFIHDQPYDKLLSYSVENLNLELTEVKLIQE